MNNYVVGTEVINWYETRISPGFGHCKHEQIVVFYNVHNGKCISGQFGYHGRLRYRAWLDREGNRIYPRDYTHWCWLKHPITNTQTKENKMQNNIRHVILSGPSVPRISPPVETQWWLELSEGEQLMHVMCTQSTGETRKVFTVYADGTGYLNKNAGIKVLGLQTDKHGRISMRDIDGLIRSQGRR